MTTPAGPWRVPMAEAYDQYFSSRHYDQRYPAPNPGTLEFLWSQGAHRATRVLDVGCGNGRYALALLAGGGGELVGCDISRAALAEFSARLQAHPGRERVQLVLGGPEDVPAGTGFDCLLMLFGVLGHIGPRTERIKALRAMRARATEQALLLLSVPSVWRRMPIALVRSALHRGKVPREDDAWSDIRYHRVIGGRRVDFHYHLYGLASLEAELAEGGWEVVAARAESVFPERLVCRSQGFAWLDGCLQRWLPASLGYGILVAARPRAMVA